MDVVVTCRGPGCRNVLTGRTDRIYCSPACRQRAYRVRGAGEAPDLIDTVHRVGRGRIITTTEALERVVDTVSTSADAAATVLRDIDLADVDSAVLPDLRARLAAAVAVYGRLLRALEGRVSE
jgi:hypothetical protein